MNNSFLTKCTAIHNECLGNLLDTRCEAYNTLRKIGKEDDGRTIAEVCTQLVTKHIDEIASIGYYVELYRKEVKDVEFLEFMMNKHKDICEEILNDVKSRVSREVENYNK